MFQQARPSTRAHDRDGHLNFLPGGSNIMLCFFCLLLIEVALLMFKGAEQSKVRGPGPRGAASVESAQRRGEGDANHVLGVGCPEFRSVLRSRVDVGPGIYVDSRRNHHKQGSQKETQSVTLSQWGFGHLLSPLENKQQGGFGVPSNQPENGTANKQDTT